MDIYQQAIEYYSAVNDPKFIVVNQKIHQLIENQLLTLNTENLDQIVLTRGVVSTYNIQNMKSLKYVSIVKDLYDSDSKFSGTLNFEVLNNVDSYPDLTTIELITL